MICKKMLGLMLITLNLTGCLGDLFSGGGKVYPIESTSTSPNPGTLEYYQYSTSYSSNRLLKFYNKDLCPDNLSQEACQANLSNLQTDFNFKPEQIGSLTTEIQAYQIQYNTPGVLNENRSVSGGVLIPTLPESQIKGIVLYFHPTEFTKYNIPSCFTASDKNPSYCLGRNSPYGEKIGAALASQGYIVAMPDYIGEGLDNMVIHPYVLYPTANIYSGLNMLNATTTLLTKINLGYKIHKLYLLGFSEGGAYVLQTAKELQEAGSQYLNKNKLELKGSVAISGAYDLSNAQLLMEEDNINTSDNAYRILNDSVATAAKPLLISYILSVYGFYKTNQDYSGVFAEAFYNCYSCIIGRGPSTIPDLYNDATVDEQSLKNYIPSSAAVTGYGVNGNNSAKALIVTGLLNSQKFIDTVHAANIVEWKTNFPVTLVHLSKDSVVTPLNSANAYSGIKSLSADGLVQDINIINTPVSDVKTRYWTYDVLNKKDDVIDHQQSEVIGLAAALQVIQESN